MSMRLIMSSTSRDFYNVNFSEYLYIYTKKNSRCAVTTDILYISPPILQIHLTTESVLMALINGLGGSKRWNGWLSVVDRVALSAWNTH